MKFLAIDMKNNRDPFVIEAESFSRAFDAACETLEYDEFELLEITPDLLLAGEYDDFLK